MHQVPDTKIRTACVLGKGSSNELSSERDGLVEFSRERTNRTRIRELRPKGTPDKGAALILPIF
jgi:hypothetical protein